jgi:hypothetical protein
MSTIKKFWLIAVVMLIAFSCKNSEDVNGSDDYYYYLDIQSEVRLNFKEADENQGTMTDSDYDLLSRTVMHMQQAVQQNNSMKGDNRTREAAMITTCDSLYRNYADKNPTSKGFLICYVKLIRCSLYPNGTIKDMQPIKYYNFWYEVPEGYGNDDGGSSLEDYFGKPDTLQAVDLGLSVLWANCNLAAKVPRNYGALVAWGDSTGILFSGQGIGWNDNGYTWNTDNYGGNNPPADISGSELDVVAKYWGDGWRIPTLDEAKELCEQCQWKLQTYGDIKWYEVIGPNGNSIIMPLAGLYGDDLSQSSNRFHMGPYSVNEMGCYWTSTSCPTPCTAEERGYGVNEGVVTAWHFRFNSNDGDDLTPAFIDYLRACHMSIRPVQNK